MKYLFLLSFLCFSSIAASELTLNIKIQKLNQQPEWAIHYSFNQPVSALSFNHTPYGFISNYWQLDTLLLDNKTLEIKSKNPTKSLSFNVSGADSNSYSQFYTPFLKYDQHSYAVYIGHYLPEYVIAQGTQNKKVLRKNIKINLEISGIEDDVVNFTNGGNGINDLINNSKIRRYVLVGKYSTVEKHPMFNLVINPNIPKWLKSEYETVTAKLFTLFEQKFKYKLPYRPLIIVAFDDDKHHKSFNGGAVDQQVALNIIGTGWQEKNNDNINALVELMSHELIHLYNSQHWINIHYTAWLHEGSAQWLAKESLYALNYLSKEQYKQFNLNIITQCSDNLGFSAIPDMQHSNLYQHIYNCGHVIFDALATALNKEPFAFWLEFVSVNNDNEYKVDDLYQVIGDKRPELLENLKILIEPRANIRKSALSKLTLSPATQ